jgi:hypothetical protein
MADPATAETLSRLPVQFWPGIVAAGMTLVGTLGAVIATIETCINALQLVSRFVVQHDR